MSIADTTHQHELSEPADICLLLRAYAEQRWLTTKLLPHLRELERAHAIPDGQLWAALAYLEVLWLDASGRAAETDAAFENLEPDTGERGRLLHERAHRYYATVLRMRTDLGWRVRALTHAQAAAQDRRA